MVSQDVIAYVDEQISIIKWGVPKGLPAVPELIDNLKAYMREHDYNPISDAYLEDFRIASEENRLNARKRFIAHAVEFGLCSPDKLGGNY